MKLSKEFIAMFREEAKKAQWEINRWNGKSIDDLVVDYLERKELKPEDFTGAVVLTVEEVSEYDPKKWNQWPKVRPIKKGNYRVEHDENGYTYKFGFYWNGHFWEGRKGYGPLCSNTFQDGFRFKPWYDEWEDKE